MLCVFIGGYNDGVRKNIDDPFRPYYSLIGKMPSVVVPWKDEMPSVPITVRQENYTLRKIRNPNGDYFFYALSTLSDEEAIKKLIAGYCGEPITVEEAYRY